MTSATSHRLRRRSAAAALLLLLVLPTALSLSLDGALLLAFRYSILDDPLSALSSWNYDDASPCSWNGVVCTPIDNATRVVALVLPNSRLLGSIPPDLAMIPHLRHLDLSGNSLNGTLPPALLTSSSSSDLRVLSLSGNEISGVIPDISPAMTTLQVLNLSDNSFTGGVPAGAASLPSLTVLSLAGNYLSGNLPVGGFERLQVLDLSSNLLNGSLPPDIAGGAIRYLNLSYNKISGAIPPELGTRVRSHARIDLSYNNLTGEIPETAAFRSQKPEHFAGNPDLCGKLLGVLCSSPSSAEAAPPPSTSPPAIAVIPKSQDGNSTTGSTTGTNPVIQRKQGEGGLSPATIAAIVVGDVAGVGLLCLLFLCVYKAKRRRRREQQEVEQMGGTKRAASVEAVASSSENREVRAFSCCMRNKCGCGDCGDEISDDTTGSEEEEEEEEEEQGNRAISKKQQQGAILVMVDAETELEMETLLRASAYILGAAASTIVYKAVLEDGTVFAVRRIGDSAAAGGGKMKEFEAQVRSISKLRHPNLLRVHGFYWAADEKLLISEFAPNGPLANFSFTKKLGSSPFHLGFEARVRIARGVASGLSFLHEKKCVHGNLKPSNILLSADMEPWIADFGLERLVLGGDKSSRSSARHLGSKRSVWSQSSLPELSPAAAIAPSPAAAAAYQAPESLQNLKASAKWDVYSFGMVLLELVAGRVFSEAEVAEWNAGFVGEVGRGVVRMADPAIRGEAEGREECLVSCLKLGFSCAAIAPQRRPSMKDALQVLERITLGSASSSSCRR